MYQAKFVFAQLTAFLDRSAFNRIVAKYGSDKYVKHFTCWNQLLALMFGQLCNRESLQDLIVALDAHRSKCYHLSMGEIPYETGSYYIFDRAYNNFKALYKIQQIDAYFVVRAKKNLQYKVVKWRRRLPKNVLSDATIELTGFYPKQYYPEQLRLVRFWDEEQRREFSFLTNATHITAIQVADLYKNRWKIELFFKWLKQHLKIKKFWINWAAPRHQASLCARLAPILGCN